MRYWKFSIGSLARTFLRRGRRPEGECNCFWRALTSTNQLGSPSQHFKQKPTDKRSVASARGKNTQLPAVFHVSKTSVLKLSIKCENYAATYRRPKEMPLRAGLYQFEAVVVFLPRPNLIKLNKIIK